MRSPFPWFGGKRRVARIVWERFGDPANYVEPFFGSGAVLLERPHEPRAETVNDKDCYLSNFWRALQNDPEGVCHYADWPVNEADLHARHSWLSGREQFRETMKTDPDYYDSKIAGLWVWGLSMWIGGGWCSDSTKTKGKNQDVAVHWQQRPGLTDNGVHSKSPKLRHGGNFAEHWRKRPLMKRGGVGVQRRRPQLPDVSGNSGAYGRGVHAVGLVEEKTGGLLDYFLALASRLRAVRVCCGDWTRIMGYSPTTAIGVTAAFLDPPYSEEAGRDPELYSTDDLAVAHDVREWAIANGDNPLMRIALCGYEGEHKMPDDWSVVAWRSHGGYAVRAEGRGKANRTRERIWFSPHCLQPSQKDLL